MTMKPEPDDVAALLDDVDYHAGRVRWLRSELADEQAALRATAAQAFAAGATSAQIGEAAEVSKHTIYSWRRNSPIDAE